MSVLLSRARAGQCRWIVCEDAGDRRDLFGGRRVCGAAVSFPTSYCLDHRLRVYDRTPRAFAPPQDASVRRQAPEPETQPLLKEADPELEKLLDEEEEIARRTHESHETPHFRPGDGD